MELGEKFNWEQYTCCVPSLGHDASSGSCSQCKQKASLLFQLQSPRNMDIMIWPMPCPYYYRQCFRIIDLRQVTRIHIHRCRRVVAYIYQPEDNQRAVQGHNPQRITVARSQMQISLPTCKWIQVQQRYETLIISIRDTLFAATSAQF